LERIEATGEVTQLQPGDPESIGPYRLHARIGAGGMGVVYLASDASGQEVALKLVREELATDPGFRARFAREVRAGQRVGGMCTAHYLDADLDSPRPYLVSEYVAGGNLADYVAEHGPLVGDRLMGLAVGLAEGLVAMGAAGVIHRDLKPTNVLMGERGPKIVDFGISVAADGTSLTQTGAVVGSPSWMAPEQAQGRDTTAAIDVFSWAATVTFAATGRQPFGEGRPDAVIYRVVHEEPDLAGVDARVLPLVRSALAKDPARRPSPDALLVGVVKSAIPGAAAQPDHVSESEATDVIERTWALPPPRTRRVTGRQIALAAAVIVVIAAFVAGALYVANGKSNPPSHVALNSSHTTTTATASITTTVPSTTTTKGPAGSTADITASLPVVSCPTSYGIEQTPEPKNLPSTLSASVPADLASQLTAYADEAGIMEVLAPSSWNCTASIGADGSEMMTVLPSGEVLPETHALPTGSQAEAIVGTQNGGCQGCADYQACPFFAAAQNNAGNCTSTTPPSGEDWTLLASNMVGFEDPPGLAGDADPSGGKYPANAVMTYTQNPAGSTGSFRSSWFETCTLPYSQQTMCTAVLNDFASRYKDS
jgi:serine/threonine protein kinase